MDKKRANQVDDKPKAKRPRASTPAVDHNGPIPVLCFSPMPGGIDTHHDMANDNNMYVAFGGKIQVKIDPNFVVRVSRFDSNWSRYICPDGRVLRKEPIAVRNPRIVADKAPTAAGNKK